jgi:queuine tRNA-ribosyltransferase
MAMRTDLMVVLDDFTPPDATYEEAVVSVNRTTQWAKRCKATYLAECDRLGIPEGKRPYLIGVVQGAYFDDLREQSMRELVKLGLMGMATRLAYAGREV